MSDPTKPETGSAPAPGGIGLDEAQEQPAEQRALAPAHTGLDAALRRAMREITGDGPRVTVLAVVIALVLTGVLIAMTDATVQKTSGYFFARPSDMLIAVWNAVSGAYTAMFRGGIFDYTAHDFATGITPLLNSLNYATPLIAAGLGLAIGFRAGVFNIGGQGQILVAAIFAGMVSFDMSLPPVIHMLVAVLAGIVGGGIWAAIIGVLKAYTGAHEVIVTIMLNYVAYYLIDYLLHTPVLKASTSNAPLAPAAKPTAVLFPLLGSRWPHFNFGFVLVILLTVLAWWLLNRSSVGFRLRAVGENPSAARVAGIPVNRMFVISLVLSGLFVGFAGAYQVLGQTTTGFGNDIDAGIGLNAITVALLGRNRPWGVFGAGVLFGILQAGGSIMQAAQGIDVDIVQVIQSLIVFFIAAPPLVRAIFRLREPGAPPRRSRRSARKEAAA